MVSNNINNEAFLTDVSDTSPVADGKPIYLRATDISYGFNNITATNAKVFQDSDETYNNRKANISYTGFDNPIINVQGLIDISNTSGSLSDTNKQVMTVGRLWQLAKSPKTYWFYDKRIIGGIIDDNDSAVESISDVGSIPVVIGNISINTTSDNLNEVAYSIELIEDREVS